MGRSWGGEARDASPSGGVTLSAEAHANVIRSPVESGLTFNLLKGGRGATIKPALFELAASSFTEPC